MITIYVARPTTRIGLNRGHWWIVRPATDEEARKSNTYETFTDLNWRPFMCLGSNEPNAWVIQWFPDRAIVTFPHFQLKDIRQHELPFKVDEVPLYMEQFSTGFFEALMSL